MRLRASFLAKVMDFKSFLNGFVGRSCAGALSTDSFDELYNRFHDFLEELEFLDPKDILK